MRKDRTNDSRESVAQIREMYQAAGLPSLPDFICQYLADEPVVFWSCQPDLLKKAGAGGCLPLSVSCADYPGKRNVAGCTQIPDCAGGMKL